MGDGPIDRSVFTELQEATGADFVEELVMTFMDETPTILDELKNAAASGEQDRYRRAAHSIKSNASIFGAHELAEMARRMELEGLKPDLELNKAGLAAIKLEFERTIAALRDMQDE